MPFTKDPAMSTDDCDVVYENITSSKQQCKCKPTGFEYPNYAAKELALFHELQLGLGQCCSADVKIKTPLEETIDLGVEILDIDDPVNSGHTKVDPDPIVCEVLWVKSENSPDPSADGPAKELDALKKPESQVPDVSPKDSHLLKNPNEKSKYDPVSSSTSNYDSSCFKQADQRPKRKTDRKRKQTLYYCCDICECSIGSRKDLKLHLLDHVKETKANAEIYNKSIEALEELNHPDGTNNQRKRHTCAICMKLFTKPRQLWHHKMVAHSDSRPWQCELCPKNYTRSSHLKRHQLIHY